MAETALLRKLRASKQLEPKSHAGRNEGASDRLRNLRAQGECETLAQVGIGGVLGRINRIAAAL